MADNKENDSPSEGRRDKIIDYIESGLFDRRTNISGLGQGLEMHSPEGKKLLEEGNMGYFEIELGVEEAFFNANIQKMQMGGKLLNNSFIFSISMEELDSVIRERLKDESFINMGSSIAEVFVLARNLIREFIQANGLERGADKSALGDGIEIHAWRKQL